VYRAQQSHLYRNNRDGTFSNVTSAAGLATQFGPALGVSTADFNGDGWIDLYVANDREENQLWINRHDGTFENRGLLSGTALGPFGEPKSAWVSMPATSTMTATRICRDQPHRRGHDLVNDGTGTFVNASAVSGIGQQPPLHRIRSRLARCGQRVAGPADRERRRADPDSPRMVRPRRSARLRRSSATSATATSRRHAVGRPGLLRRPRAVARRSATWTTAAARTSSSAATAAGAAC
jgi:hypothetical protein